MKKSNLKKSNLKNLFFSVLFFIILSMTSFASSNTFYFKLIDKTGMAPFNDNIVLQYERKVLNNIYLFTEVSQETETKNKLTSINEGFAIGFSIPSRLAIRPYMGYKYMTKKYKSPHNKSNEPVSSIFTQLNYNHWLDKSNIIIIFGRLLVEKIESTSDTNLNYDVGISYGYSF